MTLDLYVIKNGKNLRCGYTTGSCAAGAAKAATIMLETGEEIAYVEIDTPAGIRLKLQVHDPELSSDSVSCAIIKDGGDDPDNTDGMKIYARVTRREDRVIVIEGGLGIGRIRRRGLFGNVGDPAINPVPRSMIKKEVKEVGKTGYQVLIYAPQGKAIGEKTFNSRIGIEGGISIIGTKGIVYPMSDEALLKTIYMDIDMVEDKYGKDRIILVPGNYGDKIGRDLDIKGPRVKVSNYLGDSLLYVYNKGFRSISLLGHIGKFAKLSIGIFNTHSKVADARMEAFVYHLALLGAPQDMLVKVDKAITGEEALNICIEAGYGQVLRSMEEGAEKRIKDYLKDQDFKVKVIIYSMERGRYIC